MLHYEDVYSIYFTLRGMIAFIWYNGHAVQSLMIDDIWVMTRTGIIVIIHSKYLRKIGILCVYQIDLFYHSYSAVVPIDMQFLYWGKKLN